jgi:D-3-phosphoglycerate dehydrogenase
MAANSKRLVFFEPRVSRAADRIRALRPDIVVTKLEYAKPDAESWEHMTRAHGYQCGARTELRDPWFGDAALIAKCPDLLAMCSLGAGYDVIDVDACTKAGIIVCNQSGANAEAVAEHALGYILLLSKKTVLADRHMRKQQNLDRWLYRGNDILGKTVGIIGLGNIGGRVAEMCKVAFRMRVLAYDPYLTKEQIAKKGAEKVELPDLLKQSDYVTVHCPRTSESYGMLGAAEFALMKPTAYFVNTARGGIHDEPALVEALKQKQIAGAGIDVFLVEPPPLDHPLLGFDNVVVSPHNAGVTIEAHDNMELFTADQWVDIFAGEVPPRLINKEVWPKYSERFARVFGFRPKPLA